MGRMRLVDGEEPASTVEDQLRHNLEALRESRGMTQEELAERVGRSQSWVSKRLSGKHAGDGDRFQLSDLDRFARAFGLSPADLLRPGHENWDRRTQPDRRRQERRTGQQ